MKILKTIIIDDEENARTLIKSYLSEYKEIEIIAECVDGFEGALKIKELSPDLIFLDIQMPRLNGFEMLELMDQFPLIIFSTAYDEFALKAFEFGAVDYLLKPYSAARLKKALEKAFSRHEKQEESAIPKMVEYVKQNQEILQRIAVKKNHSIQILPISAIRHFEAQDDYVYIYTNQNERFIKNLTMKYLEDHLDSRDFIRVHRSHIIRLDQVSGIEHWEKDTYLLKLKDETKIPLSKSGYKKLKELLKL